MLVALRRFLFEFCYQIDLIESTGFFFAAFHTGRKVARNAVSRAIPTMIRIDVIPNTKIDAPSAEPSSPFRIRQSSTLPPIEMQEIGMFDELPENLTYPHTSPVLYHEAEKLLKSLDQQENM